MILCNTNNSKPHNRFWEKKYRNKCKEITTDRTYSKYSALTYNNPCDTKFANFEKL